MSLITLTDCKLARLHRLAGNEIARRAATATTGRDAASVIRGNEFAKRALIVATAGGHSILFVGPPNCGKTMLRAVALELGFGNTFEARPCPCGYRSDPNVACRCIARQVERHFRRTPVADVNVEMQRPGERDLSRTGTTLADMHRQIADKGKSKSIKLDEGGLNLLKAAAAELGLDADAQRRIMAVARTIANLDRSERVRPIHVCEAINYRLLGR
jgi:predicted ATPase with chaperone activity